MVHDKANFFQVRVEKKERFGPSFAFARSDRTRNNMRFMNGSGYL